jgi:toxin ParE1/3/4
LTELRHTFLFLAANPNAGTLADSLRQGIRMYSPARPARNYLIFFYLRSDGVEISDVIHAARDWAGMFDREER